jgi:hypothetical protein
VIILKIDIEDVALITMFEAESQAPIATDRHRKGSRSIAKEGMEAASPAQVGGAGGAVNRVEHQAHALMKFGPDLARPPGTKDLSTPLCENDLIAIENSSRNNAPLPWTPPLISDAA